MKKLLLLVCSLFIVVAGANAQCKTCHMGQHDPNDTSIYSYARSWQRLAKLHTPVTPNGNSSLGQSYVLQNVCGLNYVLASVETTTRATWQPGTGFPSSVTVSGLPTKCLTIQKAFLYWEASYTEATPPTTTVTLTNPLLVTNGYSSTMIGQAGSKCWGETGSASYRADVTAAIAGNGVYKFSLNGFNNAAWEVDGATLVIIYSSPATYSGSISLWDGDIVNWYILGPQTFTGISVCASSGIASAFGVFGDIQNNVNANVNTDTFNGSTASFTNDFWNCNVIPTTVTSGQTSTVYSAYTNNTGDCYSWTLAGLYWQNTTCVTCVAGSITITPTVVNPTCGNNNGSITVGVTGGSSPYTYQWSPNVSTSASASNLSAGSYTISVKDASCDSSSIVVTLVSTSLSLNAYVTSNVKCNGGATGSASDSVSGGTSPFTYSWSPSGGNNSNATGLSAGTYTVTVTDKNGCVGTSSVTITQPTPLNATVTTVDATCSKSDGSATVTSVTGGTPGYNYSWAPSGGNSSNATGLSAGTYTVTITDANGCTLTTTANVSNAAAETVTINTVTNVSCYGGNNGNITTNVTGGTLPYTYSWSPVGGNGPNATGLSVGTYTITVTDSNGCISIASATITQPTALTETTSFVGATCNNSNGSATITIGGGTPAYTYLWSNGQNSSNATGLSAGVYTVNVTDSGGCTITASVTVTNASGETVTITGTTNDSCNGLNDGTITTNTTGGTGAYTYNWTPSGGNNANASNLSAGTYTITVTDSNGCISTASATITEPTALTLAAAGFPVSCFGNSDGQATVIPSGGTGPYKYNWAPSGGNNANANGLSAGTYTVTVTDANGCTHDTAVVVTQPAQLRDSIATTVNVSCFGDNNGSATVGVTGGTTPYNYNWTPSGGNGATASGLTAGSYTVNVKDNNGCTTSASVTITQPNLLTVSDTNVSICISQTFTLTPVYNGGTVAYTYNWLPNTNLSCNTCASPVASPTVTTVYTVTVTDANGCTATATETVNVSSPLKITAGTSQAICPGGSVNLSASATGGNGVYTYTWSPAAGLSCTNCTNPVATPAATTTYTVVVNDGCSTPPDSATVTITINPLATVSFTGDTLSGCSPVCVNFKDLSTITSGSVASWSWNFGDGNSDTLQNPYHCYNTPGVYTVSLTVVSDKGCTSNVVVPNMINVYSYPVANFIMGPQPTTILNPLISFTDKSTDAYGIASWLWTFGDFADVPSTKQNPTYEYQDTGTYCATLRVTNIHGCSDSITECLVISPQFTLYIPDAFSPNGDGINDVFTASGEFVYNFKMYIFDRWGMLLYQTDDIYKGWNGTVKGHSTVCQEDTYVYLITCDDSFGDKHSYIGKVSLIK